ncbi:MAG: hypothetical protein CME71_01065 [Halobacteriovorax sp.]|nr:hypothetical protein [Halobacteriovorax sp.]
MRTLVQTTYELTRAQLKARYRNTFAGLVWVILNPLIMFGAQAIAFKHILKIDIHNYYLYLVCGLTPWIFLIMTIQMTTPVLLHSGSLLKSFKINPLVLIFSQVADNFLNFLLAFSIMYLPIQLMYSPPSWSIMLAIIPLVLLIVSVCAVCTILSLMQVFLRDTNYVVSFVTGVLFFVTPIFFSEDMVSENYRWMFDFHLPYLYIKAFRSCFYEFNLDFFLLALSKASLSTIFLVSIASWTWKRNKNELYLRI